MRLTVLGNADRYLAPLSAGSSYLLEAGDVRVLLDAGQGARAALAERGVSRLDAAWVSHMHFDHVADLPFLAGTLPDASTVAVPRGERRRLDLLADAYVWGGPWDLTDETREVDEGDVWEVGGGVRARFARSRHSAPALAARFEHEGASVVYASDTAAHEGLRALAEDCDLLLMHALLPDVDPESNHARVHATAASAGRLARDARVGHLVLSHRFHEAADAEMLSRARAWTDRVELASTGAVYEVE